MLLILVSPFTQPLFIHPGQKVRCSKEKLLSLEKLWDFKWNRLVSYDLGLLWNYKLLIHDFTKIYTNCSILVMQYQTDSPTYYGIFLNIWCANHIFNPKHCLITSYNDKIWLQLSNSLKIWYKGFEYVCHESKINKSKRTFLFFFACLLIT